VDAARAVLVVAPTAPDGMALLSVANPDGRQSNVLPLRVRALPQFILPLLTGASIAAAGSRFTLTGSLDQSYVIEHSPDLEHWDPLSTNQFPGLSLDLLDPGATNAPTRFYRVQPVE
jgi:hypothetical protein